MRLGIRPGFEYLGAELMAHEDVAVQGDFHAACTASDPVAHLRHGGSVSGEMQVGAADSAWLAPPTSA